MLIPPHYFNIGIVVNLEQLNDRQKEAVLHNDKSMAVLSSAGSGKCLGKNTPILMYDGNVKLSQNIVIGDKLMGPDSKPRVVMSLDSGVTDMVRVIPEKGDSWVCTFNHVMTLVNSVGDIKDFELHKFLDFNNKNKTKYNKEWKIIRSPIEFDMVYPDMAVRQINGKNIITTKENRLSLLAELIDANGVYKNDHYNIISKSNRNTDNILYLCRSLGFAAYSDDKAVKIKGQNKRINYQIIEITGGLEKIPCSVEGKKATRKDNNVLRVGWSISNIGRDEYYGFELSGDGRFLLGDFTVTHNTRVLVTKINYLVSELNVNPSRIWACTFTNKAADEMKGRLQPLLGSDAASKLKIGTLHSMANKIYKQGMTVSGHKHKIRVLLKNPFGILNHLYSFTKQKDFINKDAKMYLQVIANTKLDLIKPNQFLSFNKPHSVKATAKNDLNTAIYEVYVEYEKWMKKNNKMDFADMLVNCYYMLIDPKYSKFVTSLQKKCEYILVDEAQDTNTVCFKIIDLLAQHWKKVTIVGDCRQCQPAGTMVTLSNGQKTTIENIKVGSEVVTFSQNGSHFNGVNGNGKKVTEIKKRKFGGNIYTIRCDNKETKTTPNHMFLVKYNVDKKNYNGYIVYLMRKGTTFKVGQCRLFEKSINNLFSQCELNGADGWVLRLCKNKKEALLYERLISIQFGLPFSTQTFLDNLESNAITCLEQHGRDVNYPYYRTGGRDDTICNSTFKIYACNLINGIMSAPSFTGNSKPNFKPISVKYSYDNCYVYSLNVEIDHTYVADGISTCNCIYGFQGARMSNIDGFIHNYSPRIIDLNINYRSTKTIVDNANRLISYSTNLIGSPAITNNEIGEEIKFFTSGDVVEEATNIVNYINTLRGGGNDYKDITILYRVHSQAVELIDTFMIEKIPFITYNESNFFDRKEVKDIMAYLKIAMEPEEASLEDFKRIANKPSRYVPNLALNKLDDIAYESGDSIWEVLSQIFNYDISYKFKASLDSLYMDLSKLVSAYCSCDNPGDLIGYILQNMGYEKWALKEKQIKSPDMDMTLNFDALIDLARRHTTVSSLINFVKGIEEENKRKKEKGGNFVKVMSIHASKGKEFKNVILLGVCDRLYPLYRAVDEGNEAEERRVMYVALTRPEKTLCLSVIRGKLGRNNVMPSPYLNQMQVNYNGESNV